MTETVFDAHAAGYDSVAQSALGRELRRRVHTVVRDYTAPGDAVLDLGCGTGIDAAWLAPQVGSVLALDLSPEMTDLTRQRCAGLNNVIVEQADASSLQLDQPVDLVLANFGVINCVGDLRSFGERLCALLAPGGHAVLVTMSRWCPIELAVAAGTRNGPLLRRRRTSESTTTASGYQGLQVQYASAHDLQLGFGSHFNLVHSESLGLVLPPFEPRWWVEDRPKLLRCLATVDERLGRLGALARLGDHQIAVFQATR